MDQCDIKIDLLKYMWAGLSLELSSREKFGSIQGEVLILTLNFPVCSIHLNFSFSSKLGEVSLVRETSFPNCPLGWALYVGQWSIFRGPLSLPFIIVIDLNYLYTLRNGAGLFVSLCFILSNFQTLNIFVTLFSGLWGLQSWNFVHRWTMGACIVYTRISLLLLICLFIFSFFFLSNFQTLNIFITLFSGTVRPRRLKLGTHVDNGWMYCVYWNHAAALICPFIFHFSFSPIYKH